MTRGLLPVRDDGVSREIKFERQTSRTKANSKAASFYKNAKCKNIKYETKLK